jgi:hypothetical protein
MSATAEDCGLRIGREKAQKPQEWREGWLNLTTCLLPNHSNTPLDCDPSEPPSFAKILGPMDTPFLNAKARRRKGAPDSESGFLLCVFATWRLCVEKSLFSGKSVEAFLRLRLAALWAFRDSES